MKKALILVDIQNDYFKGGRHELVNPEQAASQASNILHVFRARGWNIFHIRHINSNPEASFFKVDTDGITFCEDVCPLEGEEVITKHRPDSFQGTNLKLKLTENNIEEVIICGMMTHMCIDTTVRTASRYGYSVTLIEDACATRDLIWREQIISAEEVQNAYFAALNGTFATVQKADLWIKEQSN